MANLRANKITSTEVFETTGSVQFDGSGDSLSVGTSSDLTLGTGDFTIEAYIYPSNITDAYRVIISNSYTGTIGGWSIYQYGNDLEMYYDAGGGPTPNIFDAVDVLTAGTWQHISVTRASSAMRVFVNGVQVASVSNSTDFAGTTVLIGDNNAGDYFFNGFISNLRVIKGTALYTKNFTPPTRELTVIPNTVLLACQSTTNAAREATGKTITVNGNAVANELTPGLLTDRVKSGGTSAISGSVEFDGNDYLLESTGADGFNGGLGDWTVEAWMYCTDASQSDVLINGLTSSTDRFYINFIGQTLYVGDFSINNIAIGGVKQINSWFHIAVTKSGSTYRAFINGVLIGSSTESLLNSTLTSLQIGYRGSQNYYTKGFISNLRIVKGTAVYTSNFIPPTRELKKLPGTVLLCCKNSSDPTAEETGKTITPFGNATARNFSPQVGFDGSVTFDGVTKINTPNYFYLPTGNTEDRGRGRGIFGHGASPSTPTTINTISYIDIQSSGIAQDFGDLTNSKLVSGSTASSIRGLWGGGYSNTNVINYITISTTSNAQDFGDLTQARHWVQAGGNNTRGLFCGGNYGGSPAAHSNVIDYVTIASTGDAIDFGDSTRLSSVSSGSACQSSTRTIFAGGGDPSNVDINIIEYVTTASTGNAQDFGDMIDANRGYGGCSSPTRGLFMGGSTPTIKNTITYITIASTGNAQDFGDLTQVRSHLASCSNSIRGVAAGGYTPIYSNTIDYVIVSSTGNANDFGDLTYIVNHISGCSDSHGGLG